MKGKAVMVTGGGGSIGSEICDRVATFGASRLLMIENSEPALYAVTEALAERAPTPSSKVASRTFVIANGCMRLMNEFKPDIVFHAAALQARADSRARLGRRRQDQHFGSVNVADAALASGAEAMVMISTDKAIEPVSMLGLTKRFAEMYCQALDHEFAVTVGWQAADAADFGAVRQCAGIERIGGAEIQGADRGRRPGHGHPSGHGQVFHDHPGSLRSGDHRGHARA